MRSHVLAVVSFCLLCLSLASCGWQSTSAPKPPATTSGPKPSPKSEIPPEHRDEVLAANLNGMGQMERLTDDSYAKAVQSFRKVRKLAPDWIPGSINLAIALLNQTGSADEVAKKGGDDGKLPPSRYDEALALLEAVNAREPSNPYARYCRGIILKQVGRTEEAHEQFLEAAKADPDDANIWDQIGSTYPDSTDPAGTASADQRKKVAEAYEKALKRNPYLASTYYRLMLIYGQMGDRERQKTLLAKYKELFPYGTSVVPGTGEAYETVYGFMGKYATVIHPFKAGERARSAIDSSLPHFETPAPIRVRLPGGDRWARSTDFVGPFAVIGRARARFGAAVATFDANNDGKADLFLASCVKGEKGIRDALLLNKGDGSFEDASAAFGLPDDRGSLGVAAADFDADRFIDLFLAGVGGSRLLKNDDGKTFTDITSALKPVGPPALSLTARWLDLDQDGDLDLYVVNYAPAANADAAFADGAPPPGTPNVAYRNDGVPKAIAGSPPAVWSPLATAYPGVKSEAGLSVAFTPWTDQDALSAGNARHDGVAALDLDLDRDVDLVASCEGEAPVAIFNDRIGRFHAEPLDDLKAKFPGSGLLVTDVDRDGRPDLIQIYARGRNSVWRNAPPRQGDARRFALEFWPTNTHDWRSASAVDLDLDGAFDLLGLPSAANAATLEWARDDGSSLSTRTLDLGDDSTRQVQGMGAADLVGNPLPDLLLVRDGEDPRVARNLGNGNHWMALRLGGYWRVRPEQMRTNFHGIGTRLLLQGRDHFTSYDHTTPDASLSQSIAPIVLGLGPKPADATTLLHLTWPDNVMQCEMNLPTDEAFVVAENNRKSGSCPVLFTWNGEKFTCLGDFLGGGGLGYLVAPGIVSRPDRDEAVAITDTQLRDIDGLYRMSITEPMDEVAYLDHLRLDVVDRPPGIQAVPDERFAPGGNRPTGDLLTWKTTIDPVKATDLKGNDLTDVLRRRDRVTADRFKRLYHWIGYAEEHGIVLDFGDELASFRHDDRLILALAGWVEYPYSQTNYAASTAGVALQPPVLERRNPDSTWSVLEPDPGYPAGLPRLTTLTLRGDQLGAGCVLRLRTNMECYWDQAFLAISQPDSGVRVTTLPMFHGKLGARGYTREVSPDGRLPLLYDYNSIDPPLWPACAAS